MLLNSMVTDYDLLVIGGGIHGAACAQAASAKGYRVLVLEQFEKPGLATSSKSSKLIHGGLRYLETGQFKLVHECLRERQYLLNNAPQLVKLVPFYIPVYKHTRRSAFIIRIGLMIYSLFSKKKFRSIAKSEWPKLDNLKTENLDRVFQYYDAQTDDQQLTEAVMDSAQQLGAVVYTSTSFDKAECTDDMCTIYFTRNNQSHTVTSKLIINTSGPWVNQVLKKIQPEQSCLDIDLVLGTHIIIDRKTSRGIYYLEAPQDQRVVFVMPWNGGTMMGTTETHYSGSLNNITAPDEDIDYLITVYNHYFDPEISRQNITDTFAGLRVLPATTASAFTRPRDTIIHHNNVHSPRVFSLYGGKLTAHRATAANLMKVIEPLLPRPSSQIDTRYISLQK